MSYIHLIYPDVATGYYPYANHGLAFLIGAIRAHGHRASLHHVTSNEPADMVASRAVNCKSDIIGFSLSYNQVPLAEKYIQALRSIAPNVFLLAGGISPSTGPDAIFSRLDVDAIAIGEAEYNLVALMDAIHKNKKDLYNTPGFYFRLPNGKIQKNSTPPLNSNLEELAWPDYSDFNMKKIIRDSAGWRAMLLSRGCPFNCNYCCNSILMNLYPVKKDYFRISTVQHAINLIKHNLSHSNNVKGIIFDDDLLCLNKKWFLDFAYRYKQEIGLPYTMNSRVESLTMDVISAMKDSNCQIVCIGVESGNAWVRETLLNRRYSNEQLIETFHNLKSAGIRTSVYNMLALPFESKSQMMDTFNLNRKLSPYRGSCFYFFPYPNTRLYDICKEFNLLQEDSKYLSGYFSSPAIKLTHCTVKDAKSVCNKLRLYLYLNRILVNLKIGFAIRGLYCLMIPFAGIISRVLAGDSKLKSRIRSFVYLTTFSSKK